MSEPRATTDPAGRSPSELRAAALEDSARVLSYIRGDDRDLADDDRRRIAKETVENFEQHVNRGFVQYRKAVTQGGDFAAVEWQGRGAIFTDVLGREFIDCLGGYGIYDLGIRHPEVVSAVQAQLGRSPLSSQELLDPLRAYLARLLALITPGDLQYAFICNSGTEAVEGAIKLAKLVTGRSGFITSVGGFHGKTLGSLSLMGKAAFRQPYVPLLPDVRHVPFGDAAAVESALDAAAAVGTLPAAVVMEPIQGEAGAVVPPDDFWPRLRAATARHGVLLIADEVQTGLGRTGTLWGVDHWGVTPDILCAAKSLGGGVMPIGAFVASAELWRPMEPNPFMHTTTFGGNPLSCAAAIAAIHVTLRDDLPGHAAERGAYMAERLAAVQARHPDLLVEVRGRGMLIGLVFSSNEVGYEVASELFRRGVLVAGTLISATTLRIEPPLEIPYELLDQVLERLEASLEAVAAA